MTDSNELLLKLNSNLHILREREAKYAGNTPLELLNQIEDHRRAIDLTEQLLAGHLSEADWREALRPLLVNIGERQSEAARITLGDVGRDIINSIMAGGDVYYSETHHHYAAPDQPSDGPLSLNTAPPPPENFIPRPREFNQLLEPLLDSAGARTLALTTALQGGGGFGKTSLAQAVCHDERVQTAYPLILWLTLGESPALIELLNNQIRRLDLQADAFTDVNAAAARLRDLLTGRPALIVLDDIWQEADATAFLQRSPTCVNLLTTRRQDLVSRLDAEPVDINEMTTNQAVELLISGLRKRPADIHPLRTLAVRLGKWPLLLNLAKAQLKELIEIDQLSLAEALAELEADLTEEGFTTFDRTDEQQRNRAISISLGLSLERLGPWREQYLALAIFRKDVDLPFAALEHLWGLKPRQARKAIRAMQRLSLFTHYDPQAQTIRLHDVIRHYLIDQHNDLAQLHARFLNTYRPLLASPTEDKSEEKWSNLPPEEPYLWDHLCYHLIEAGLIQELYNTVTDLCYLAAKSHARSTNAVEADLLAAQAYNPDDGQLPILSRHFINAAHLLNRCDDIQNLQRTLHSRLAPVAELVDLNRRFATALTRPYLTPVWPLPDLPHPALTRTLASHTHWVWGCAFSPDGRSILSASWDNTLRLWDAQTGQLRRTLDGHQQGVWDCAFSPDGQTILSASRDHTLKLWDAQTGQARLTLTGHRAAVTRCTFSPDGQSILSASLDRTLKLWDARTGQLRHTLKGHTHWVWGCAFSPDGQTILSASRDKTLILWDTQTGQARLTLKGHTSWVLDCAFSPDGLTILSASTDNYLKLWDAQTGQPRLTFYGHTAAVWSCAFSPDGQTVLAASSDNTLKLWDAQTGLPRSTFTGHTADVCGCAFSPDGHSIVSASRDNTLKLWDAQTGQSGLPPIGHTAAVLNCAFSPDGRTILSGSSDRTLILWDVQTGQPRLSLSGHRRRGGVHGCAFSPDGQTLLSASGDWTLKLWDGQSGQAGLTLKGHVGPIWGCAFSPDGQTILSASRDNTLKLWDAQSGQLQLTFKGHTGWVADCAFSPDGQTLLSASKDETLKLWDAQSGQPRLTLKGHTNAVWACAFSSDGRTILSASSDRTLMLWDAQSGQPRLTFIGHADYVYSCAFHPDGQTILSASKDKTLKLWDASNGHCLVTLPVEGPLFDCAWSPDGSEVVAVGDGGVYFFRVVI